jgi:hypothetical protein
MAPSRSTDEKIPKSMMFPAMARREAVRKGSWLPETMLFSPGYNPMAIAL